MLKKSNLEKKSYLHCESCGEYHPEDECESVTIEIIKGKNCPLPKQNIFEKKLSIPILEPQIAEISKDEIMKKEEAVMPTSEPDFLKNPNLVKLVSPEEKNKFLRKNKAIPPEFRSMAIPPNDPRFEKEGMKISRKVP